MILLDGQRVSQQILESIKTKIDSQNPPILDIILVGNDPSSLKYTTLKSKVAKSIGIITNFHHLAHDTSQDKIVKLIDSLNQGPSTGIMIQLPIPANLDKFFILNSINPQKDVDGLTSTNLGLLFHNDPKCLVSATAMAIYEILKFYKIDLSGKNAVIVNNTPLIGLPLTALFNNNHATVTLCHKYTLNLKNITNTADILISAVGIPKFIKANMVKNGAIVIGAGFGKNSDTGLIEGDLDFDNVKKITSAITPNTHGVGPVTVACLLKNVVKVYTNGLSKNPTI